MIVSDLHLGLRTSRPAALLETLQHWRFDRLILLGDILHGNGDRHFCADSWRFLRFMRELAQGRTAEIVWVHGNHDRHLSPLVRTLTGIEVTERYVWEAHGRRLLALHGDRFDWFNHRLPAVGNAIGRAYAIALHRLSIDGRWPRRLDDWHIETSGLSRRVGERAARYALAHGFDVVLCGHTHRPAARRFAHASGRVVTYANAGAWVNRPASFLTVDGGEVLINRAY